MSRLHELLAGLVTRTGRLGTTPLAVVLLTTLLSAASVLQPAAAAAPEAAAVTLVDQTTTTPVAALEIATAAQRAKWARTFKQGCPGITDALCDLGGDAVDCAKDPIECGKEVAGGVKDGAENLLPDNLPGNVGDLLPDSCGVLDALCDAAGNLPGLGGIPGVPGIPGIPDLGDLFGGGIPGLGDIPNPFEAIGDIIAKAAADAWTAAMLAIWNSGLFVLRIVLTFAELFLTPDLSGDGPGKDVYAFALWLALGLVVILAMIQLGVAAFKREGKSLARALVGAGQFVVINAVWFGYCVIVVAACGAITRALMKSLLKVQTWPDFDPLGGLGVDDITDAGVATALAFLGIFLWLAAIGHLLVYLARAASLLVLAATGPVSAAGLALESTRSWFWKSLRWFHAAALTPVLMVMVLGIGVQFANGVAAHLAEDTAKAFGTALPAVMTILVSVVAPLALFKLLAFADPGTPSGASFRQAMAIQGGFQGLFGGGGGGTSSAASTTDANGLSSGEQSAESATGDRFNKSTQGFLGSFGGVGQALSTGMGWINSGGAKATALMADETNQAGVGQSTYGPDFSNMGGRQGSQSGQSGDQSGGKGGTHPGSQSNDDDTPPNPPTPTPPTPPTPPTLPTGGPDGGPGGGSGGGQGGPGGGAAPKTPAGGGGAAGGAGGAGAAGGAIPPVAV